MIVVPVEKRLDWKRPPWVLTLIVALNVLVFAFYQTGDYDKLIRAAQMYEESQLLDLEWRAYKAFSRTVDLPFEVEYKDEVPATYVISDPRFSAFLERYSDRYIAKSDFARWQTARADIDTIVAGVSSNAYGLYTTDVKVLQLFTHMFLHGDIMHLAGNMVFLVLTGFAVEAAVGSLMFLGLYFVGGLGAAFFYIALDQVFGGEALSLIGASGAVSGVMAMYIVLFGTRKIDFFYWFIVFTGYFRAAAIIMLPFYIAKEVYYMFSDENSNVAFTAHIGGFLAGAAAISLLRNFHQGGIDEHYLANKEDDLPADPLANKIQAIYQAMGQGEFTTAWRLLKPLKQANPQHKTLIDIEYNLVRALHPRKLKDYLLHRLDKGNNNKQIVLAQLELWRRMDEQGKASLAFEKHTSLFEEALKNDCFHQATLIYKSLKARKDRLLETAVLARRLAAFCKHEDMADRADNYNEQANQLVAMAEGR